MSRRYPCRKLTETFGIEAIDVDLNGVNLEEDHEWLEQLRDDLRRHRAVLFRRQRLSGSRQVEISSCLGRVQSTFYKHPRSPHPDIFRVSNDKTEGCTNVGRSGWHLDGTFQSRPFQYQTMYFESVVPGGNTLFMPLHEFFEAQSKETQERWDHLWMMTERREAPIHPLVCQHPHRKDTTMLFHCGRPFCQGWLVDAGDQVTKTTLPAAVVQDELTESLNDLMPSMGLTMQWEEGDFIINDNLALAHFASDGTQADPTEHGLRILHRTTIVGGPETIPRKADGRCSFRAL